MKTLKNILHILRFAVGGILTLVGFSGILFGILALLDPAGSKLADDNDPLGAPPTILESLLITLFYSCISILGVSIIIGLKRLKNLFLGGPTTS